MYTYEQWAENSQRLSVFTEETIVINKTLVIKCLSYDSINKQVICDASGFLAIVPEDEFSYSELKFVHNIPVQIKEKLGENICANIIEYTDGIIYLSRKENQLKHLKEDFYISKRIVAMITNISSFGIFVDAGNGITGFIPNRNFSERRVTNYGLQRGNLISAYVVDITDAGVTLIVNEQAVSRYRTGDTLNCTICSPLPNQTGYFVRVNDEKLPNGILPSVGIVDSCTSAILGNIVSCVVKSQLPDGKLRLSMIG